MKVSVYIAASFDGFIARADGGLDWLPGSGDGDQEAAASGEHHGEGEDYGWNGFWESVDCMVMGRKTFEKVLGFGVWPYEDRRVLVLSRTLDAPPPDMAGKVEIYHGDLAALVQSLEGRGYQRLYVDGGQTIQAFLRQGLVTDMTVTIVPVLIGQGVPLFGPLGEDIPLTHTGTTSFGNGFVQVTYDL